MGGEGRGGSPEREANPETALTPPDSVPSESLQRDLSAGGESNPFRLKQNPLSDLVPRYPAAADPALGIDDPVPWHPRAGWQRVHGISNLPGAPRRASQTRHLAVGGYPASGNAAHDSVDAGVNHGYCY